jgi:hypothetical protein
MSQAALLEAIVHTRVRLANVSRMRITLGRGTAAATLSRRAPLAHFVARRLPILRFHNEQLKVDLRRPQGAKAPVGIQVQRGQ